MDAADISIFLLQKQKIAKNNEINRVFLQRAHASKQFYDKYCL